MEDGGGLRVQVIHCIGDLLCNVQSLSQRQWRLLSLRTCIVLNWIGLEIVPTDITIKKVFNPIEMRTVGERVEQVVQAASRAELSDDAVVARHLASEVALLFDRHSVA